MHFARPANVFLLQMSEVRRRPSNPGHSFSIVAALTHDSVLCFPVMFEPFVPVRSVESTNFAPVVVSGIIVVLS